MRAGVRQSVSSDLRKIVAETNSVPACVFALSPPLSPQRCMHSCYTPRAACLASGPAGPRPAKSWSKSQSRTPAARGSSLVWPSCGVDPHGRATSMTCLFGTSRSVPPACPGVGRMTQHACDARLRDLARKDLWGAHGTNCCGGGGGGWLGEAVLCRRASTDAADAWMTGPLCPE